MAIAKTRDRSRSPMQLSDDSSHSSDSVSSNDERSDRGSDSQDTSNESSDASNAEDEEELEEDDNALGQESLQYLRHTLNMAEFGSLYLTMNGLLEIIDGLEPSEEEETGEETDDGESDISDASEDSETADTSSALGTDEEGEEDFVLPQEAITLLQAILLAATNLNLALSKNMLRDLISGIRK
jgi:hypothetical protein